MNYSTSDGMKLYNASIVPLSIKDCEGTGTDMQTWLNDLIEHTEAMNWMFIFTVMAYGVGYFIPCCLPLTLQQVQAHAIMKLAKGNIKDFNDHVYTLVNELESISETMNDKDLVINLMKGYDAAPDKAFVKQMQDKHNQIMYYNDPDAKLEQIMHLAEQFWIDQNNTIGIWGKPTSEEQHIAHVINCSAEGLYVKQ